MKLSQLGFTALIGLAGAVGFAARSQSLRPLPTYVIDLNLPQGRTSEDTKQAEDRLKLPFGKHSRPSHEAEPPESPLTLQLLSLDRAQYEVGEPFVYTVLISNNGKETFAFPTFTDHNFKKDTPDATGALVSLFIDDAILGLQTIGTQALFGAPEVPESLIKLKPGETLEVRASGKWFLQSPLRENSPLPWTRSLQVRGLVQFFSTRTVMPPLKSSVPIDLMLRKGS